MRRSRPRSSARARSTTPPPWPTRCARCPRDHEFSRLVRVSVANQKIVLRLLDLPQMDSTKDLDAAVRFQAQEHIPMPLDQAVIDFQPLGAVQTSEGARTRVALVATRRDMVDRLLAAPRSAGLRPVGIDLAPFAMLRALELALAWRADPSRR